MDIISFELGHLMAKYASHGIAEELIRSMMNIFGLTMTKL